MILNMATQKQQRWYEIDGEELRVYNAEDPAKASAASHTNVRDLPFYRNNFHLRKAKRATETSFVPQ